MWSMRNVYDSCDLFRCKLYVFNAIQGMGTLLYYVKPVNENRANLVKDFQWNYGIDFQLRVSFRITEVHNICMWIYLLLASSSGSYFCII